MCGGRLAAKQSFDEASAFLSHDSSVDPRTYHTAAKLAGIDRTQVVFHQ